MAARVSQVVVETIEQQAGTPRVSQVALEYLYLRPASARVTQLCIEILWPSGATGSVPGEPPDPEEPEPEPDCILERPSASCWVGGTVSAQAIGAQPTTPESTNAWGQVQNLSRISVELVEEE